MLLLGRVPMEVRRGVHANDGQGRVVNAEVICPIHNVLLDLLSPLARYPV